MTEQEIKRFQEQFTNIIDTVRDIRKTDLSIPDDPKWSTLAKAEKRKNDLADFLLWTLDGVVDAIPELSSIYLQGKNKAVMDALREINDHSNAIARVANSPNHPDFEKWSRDILNKLKSLEIDPSGSLSDLRLTIAASRPVVALREAEIVSKAKELQEGFDSAMAFHDEISTILDSLRADVEETQKMKKLENYSKLSDRHEKHERWWFWAMATCAGALIWSVVSVVFFSHRFDAFSASANPNYILIAVRQSLLIGTLLLLMRLAVTKYTAERKLRTLYDHRRAAIEHLNIFLLNLEPHDLSALRHEAAKMLLADPDTGDGSPSSPTEVNISPKISAA